MLPPKRFHDPLSRRFFTANILLGTGVIILFILGSIINSYEFKNRFCTLDDELYQTIQANIETWVATEFRPNQSSSRNHIDFSTPNGQKYTAIGMEPDRFFVVVEYDTPHTYMGLKGYVYLPNNTLQFSSEYNLVEIGENLYCYESKL